ncbi:MAG: hypothetical protein ACM36C_13040 [Acidobacteriota bacterium]
MKRERTAIVFVLLLGTACLLTPSASDAASKKPQHSAPPPVSGTQVSVQVVFSRHDVQVIREYYAPRYRSLPPGLQKKYQRTGQLPPGWQKKVQPFPVALDRRLVALPVGYSRGMIDGHAVIFNSRTGTIFDVAVLF